MSRTRKVKGIVHVEEMGERWGFPDSREDGNVGSCAGAYHYLLRVCPTTREAVKKLAAMRRIVREMDRDWMR